MAAVKETVAATRAHPSPSRVVKPRSAVALTRPIRAVCLDLALSSHFLAVYARLTRAAMIETAGEDYVRTARAKGVHPFFVTVRHVLRNALLPVTTVAGVHLGNLLGGAATVEMVFSWPGLGRLALEAVEARDFTMLLGVLLLSSLVVVAVNILVDLLHHRAQRRADRDGHSASHDAVGAQVPRGDLGDVHAPALALADARCLAEELGHHGVHFHALGDALAVTAVGRIDQILRLDRRAYAGRRGLLAYTEVRGAVYLAKAEEPHGRFLKSPGGCHVLVHEEKLLFWNLQRSLLTNDRN